MQRAAGRYSVAPVASKRQWTIRPFAREDRAGVQKLWLGLASFDGSVPARSLAEIDARLEHPAHQSGAHWRVAVAGNGAIVGALEVGFVGSVRTELLLGVNPAWRRQGIGRALLEAAPQDRRLLVSCRASMQAASALLSSAGFTERYREARMRRRAKGLEPLEVPDGARVEVDEKQDVVRLLVGLQTVFGDDAETDEGLLRAWLARPGCTALYLSVARRDYGVCLVAGSEHAKKSERTPTGEPKIGVVEQVGLARSLRGKGMSRPLVRAGLLELARAGFQELEVLADRRRESAVELYEAEGFLLVDEDVHWMRREPG
jgi:mycothiol synthase